MIHIREYKCNDKNKLIQLLRLNTPMYFDPNEEKDLIYYLDNEIEDYYVVELNNEIIGCGGINYKENNSAGYLSWDIIHPDYQSKGFGSLLVNHRIDKLKSNIEIKSIIVRTTQLVYKFYEKLGFKLVEYQKDYWAKGYDLYKMEYQKL